MMKHFRTAPGVVLPAPRPLASPSATGHLVPHSGPTFNSSPGATDAVTQTAFEHTYFPFALSRCVSPLATQLSITATLSQQSALLTVGVLSTCADQPCVWGAGSGVGLTALGRRPPTKTWASDLALCPASIPGISSSRLSLPARRVLVALACFHAAPQTGTSSL